MAAYCQELGFDSVTRFSDRSPAVNNNPTLPERTNLLLALDAIEQQYLKPEDSVWFFFSGHGASQGNRDYLLPADGNPRLLADTAIPIDRAIRVLRRCEAGNLVLILDMCRNEVYGKAMGTQTERLAREEGIITLFSCKPGEQSYELPDLQQGAFTYALLEALRGDCHPRRCHAKELSRYLRQRVPELTQQFGAQTPGLIAELYEKGTQILLPAAISTATPSAAKSSPIVNLETLKTDALLAERKNQLEQAKQLWKEINRLAESQADRDLAVEMLMEIAQKLQASQTAALQSEKTAPSETTSSSPGASVVTGPEKSKLLPQSSQSQQVLEDLTAEQSEIDYYRLRDLLQQGKWKEADRETTARLLKVMVRQKQGWLRVEDIQKFPCKDLKIVDRLWVGTSQSKFGLSIQKQIWQECGSPKEYNADWKKFCDRIGWRKDGQWLSYDHLIFEAKTAPKCQLPLAHLPWVFEFGVKSRVWRLGEIFSRVQSCKV